MLSLLKERFGFDRFLPMQEEIIAHVFSGRDTLVLMPTGGGKSLCYQLPALKMKGLTIVVSPLVSLMKDQVDSLKANGIAAEFINSSLAPDQIESIKKATGEGEVKILYVAPERLSKSGFRQYLNKLEVSLIAIDEAHCISEWGHDFRPDYRNLKTLREEFPRVPVVALTATATEKVRDDICGQLGLEEPTIFQSSFDRPNLQYLIRPKRNTFRQLVDLLREHRGQSAIIYCASRNETESLSADLTAKGFPAISYHGGLESGERKATQERFIRDEAPIITATIAFGMGIDKPDVRLVVHYSLPKSLEGYYQETGRAGRDGLPSKCVLFYSYGDKVKQDFFIERIEEEKEQRKARRKLRQMIRYCELVTCRRQFLIRYFGERWDKEECGACDICLDKRESFDGAIIFQKIFSAVVRTGERFGSNYIMEVLQGRNTKNIRARNHQSLSVYGIVKDYTQEELREIMIQLVGKKLLAKSDDEYPILKTTPKGWELVRSKESLLLPKPKKILPHKSVSREKEKEYLGEIDINLFEELRNLRKRIADEKGVPPFIVFGDRSLRDMATRFPRSKEEFSQVTGVGAQKLETYGEAFMGVVKAYLEKNPSPRPGETPN